MSSLSNQTVCKPFTPSLEVSPTFDFKNTIKITALINEVSQTHAKLCLHSLTSLDTDFHQYYYAYCTFIHIIFTFTSTTRPHT